MMKRDRDNEGRGRTMRLDPVVSALLNAYWEGDEAHSLLPPESQLPDRRAIGRVVHRLPELLFPGHHGPSPHCGSFAGRLARRVSAIRVSLVEQVTRALRFQLGPDRPKEDYRGRGEETVDSLFLQLPDVIRLVKADVRAAFASDPASHDHHEIISTYPGLFAIITYRVAHILYKMNVPLLPRIMTEEAHSRTGIDIHPGAVIGPAFFIDHGTGVVIGETAEIGSNVTLYQGVTIGALNFRKDSNGELLRGPRVKRHPTIEDNVVIYANASVLGGRTVVGRNSKIGANVRLTESVGPEMLVRVDRPNFRVEPRIKLGTHDVPAEKGAEAKIVKVQAYDYWDRVAESRNAGEGGANCGDVDEMDWPRR